MGKKHKHKKDDEFDLVDPPTTSLMALDQELYLRESEEPQVVPKAIFPPDLERCQCEWPDQSENTFGPSPRVRCENTPSVVAFQKRSQQEDGPTGAISLCDDHHVMIEHMYPGQCNFLAITSDKKIGGVV